MDKDPRRRQCDNIKKHDDNYGCIMWKSKKKSHKSDRRKAKVSIRSEDK